MSTVAAETPVLVDTSVWIDHLRWVDAHLLASGRLTRLSLWTLDRPLAAVARDLGLAV